MQYRMKRDSSNTIVMSGQLYTIGHSTRPLDELVSLLGEVGVDRLVDVRTVRKSRRNPQYAETALAPALRERGIEYVAMPGLGGLRKPRKDSHNTGWRNESFRGYADHMESDTFAKSLAELLAMLAEHTVAVMCAEAVPWRCHRSLIGDAATVAGVPVLHIMGPGKRQPHRLTPFAVVHGGRLSYPGEGAAAEA